MSLIDTKILAGLMSDEPFHFLGLIKADETNADINGFQWQCLVSQRGYLSSSFH
jgi:hypothetical protein